MLRGKTFYALLHPRVVKCFIKLTTRRVLGRRNHMNQYFWQHSEAWAGLRTPFTRGGSDSGTLRIGHRACEVRTLFLVTTATCEVTDSRGRRVRDQSFWTSWDRKGTPLHSAKRTTKSNGRPQTVPWWLRSRFQNQSDGTDLTRRLDLTGFGIRYGQVAASFLTKQRS